MTILIIYLGLVIVPCVIANNKGLGLVRYFFISLFLTPITGTVFAIRAKPSKIHRAFHQKHEACPHCGEMLFDRPVICKYCGKDLTVRSVECEKCGRKYKVKVSDKMKRYKCKQCESFISVPARRP